MSRFATFSLLAISVAVAMFGLQNFARQRILTFAIDRSAPPHLRCFNSSEAQDCNMESVEFEVFGRVQGVFFRKYTRDKAKELSLKGWVMNTNKGTVVGIAQGPCDKICEFKRWLRDVGSPQSRIEKCDFKKQKSIIQADYPDFTIKHF